jgi:HK97 family phage major capsid protein
MAEMSALEKKIRDERATVWDGVKALMEKMDSGEKLSAEDCKNFDDRQARMDDLNGDLERVMKAQEREAGFAEVAETRGISTDENLSETDAYTRAYRSMFIRGVEGMSGQEKELILRGQHTPTSMEVRAQLDGNSMQTVPGQGGYMIPQGFWQNLQIAMKAYGGVLSHCNVVKTGSGNEMPWPTSNPTGILGSYITEANQVGFTDFTFGQGVLYAWTITSGVILASFQLINDSAFSVDAFVTDRMGEAIGRKVAQELWTGAGSASKAMTGIMTAVVANGGAGSGVGGTGYVQATAGSKLYTLSNFSGSGAGSSQVSSGIATWNDLTRMIAGVDPAYRVAGKCNWYMNDTQVQLERTLSDGFGHPMWEPNTQAGQPDVILGYPVVIDNNIASVNATTTPTPGGIVFGDLKTAFVVRQVDMAGTMRLTERYADYLQVGYLSYVRMDSQPNDLRAISVFENAAS